MDLGRAVRQVIVIQKETVRSIGRRLIIAQLARRLGSAHREHVRRIWERHLAIQ